MIVVSLENGLDHGRDLCRFLERVRVSDVRCRHGPLVRLVEVVDAGEKEVDQHQDEKATLAIHAQVPIAMHIENAASVGHVHRPRSVIALCRRAQHLQAKLFFLSFFLSSRCRVGRAEERVNASGFGRSLSRLE